MTQFSDVNFSLSPCPCYLNTSSALGPRPQSLMFDITMWSMKFGADQTKQDWSVKEMNETHHRK